MALTKGVVCGCIDAAVVFFNKKLSEGRSKDTCGSLFAPVKGESWMCKEALSGQKNYWKSALCCASGVSRCL